MQRWFLFNRWAWPGAVAVLAVMLVAMLALMPAPTRGQTSQDLFLSEYVEGSSNNKALEIYNGTGAAVDLAAGGYSVQMYFNGNASAGLTINLTGTIAPGDVFVLAQASAAPAILSVADQTNDTGWFNGDDAVVLRKGATVLDVIGQVGSDPGTEWGSGLTSTADNTLRRKAGITSGDPNGADAFDPAAQWDGFASDTFAGLGAHSVVPGTPSATPSATPTGTPAGTPTPTPTGTPTGTPTATPTATPVATPSARIRQIQGAAHVSPLNNQTVTNVPGIVTALRSNGFYIQDPQPDADERTSEGIFVFTSSAPSVAVGDSVLVSGRVSEFRAGGQDGQNNLAITQIGSPTVTTVSRGNALPAATVIGAGGRVPPTTVIDNDTNGNVETGPTVFDPAQDGIDFYESLEGMRVQVNDAVVVGPTNDFGEIVVLADNGAGAGVRTPRGGIIIQQTDFNPERIILDDAIRQTPVVNVADRFPGAVVGVIDYSFGNFKLQVTEAPAPASGGLQPETTTAVGANQLAVATFNVENLDPRDPPAKFDALARVMVTNLRAPDIVALEEVQDNNGPTNDSVVAADQTYTLLIQAIQRAGGPTYEYRGINPVDDQDGGEPGGNIRVGFLYRTDRGVAFVDRPGGGPTMATSVSATPFGPQISSSPGRIDPTNPAFANSRKPLVGEFTYQGNTLFVIANHFNSKGGDQPLFGRFQPPQRITEAQRRQQAQVVADFVRRLLAVDPNTNVIVLGDFNDFEFSEALGILEAAGLTNLIETLPQPERYTYVFEGNSQALDHILVSANLARAGVFAYDVVHVNAEFAAQVSDHDPQVARFTLPPRLQVPSGPAIGAQTREQICAQLAATQPAFIRDRLLAQAGCPAVTPTTTPSPTPTPTPAR